MPESFPNEHLPEHLYPMASHHKKEIERHFSLRSEAGTQSLRASLENVQVVFLCFTNRVGSNYLTDLLSLAGYGVRVAEEDFNSSSALAASRRFQIKAYDAYLDHVVRATKRNGTCVWKIGAPQLLWLSNRGLVSEFFRSAKYIFLRRRDKTAQAVSLYIANHTGKYVGAAGDNVALEFDKVEIARQLLYIIVGESHLEYFYTLHGIRPYELWYENLAAKPQESILELSKWLGYSEKPWLDIDAPIDQSRSVIKKQHSETKELFIQQMHNAFILKPRSL